MSTGTSDCSASRRLRPRRLWPVGRSPTPPCPTEGPPRPDPASSCICDVAADVHGSGMRFGLRLCMLILYSAYDAISRGERRVGVTVAVAGASGYAGGELLRLLAGHPEFEITRRHGQHAGRRRRLGRTPAPGRPRPDASRRPTPTSLAGADLVFLALPHGESAALAARLPAGVEGRRPGRRPPAARPARGRRTTAARTRTRGRMACPSCPASGKSSSPRTGSPPPAATRSRRRWPSPHCSPPGIASPDDVVVVAASGTTGAGRALKAEPARQRGHGRPHGVQGRRASAHPGDQAGDRRPTALVHARARRRCPAASSPR